MTPTPTPQQILELDEYDAGLLSDFGGGDVEWWQDYIRSELSRAHDFYQSQAERFGQDPAVQQEPVAVRHRKTGQLESAAAFAEPYDWGDRSEWEFLYTRPAPAEVREPLTNEQYDVLWRNHVGPVKDFGRSVEQAHGITGSKA